MTYWHDFLQTHKHTLFYALSAFVCVCVCTFTKYINYFTHCLYIQLLCIKCFLLADGCEDVWDSQVSEKMVGVSQGREGSDKLVISTKEQMTKPFDPTALLSLQRMEQCQKPFRHEIPWGFWHPLLPPLIWYHVMPRHSYWRLSFSSTSRGWERGKHKNDLLKRSQNFCLGSLLYLNWPLG